jgi:hypothetical protein
MKRIKITFKKAAFTLALLFGLMFSGNLKAQTYTFVAYQDYNGDGFKDWYYWVTGSGGKYAAILHGIPSGTWPVGNQIHWRHFFLGYDSRTVNISGGIDLDGYGGLELVVWLMPQADELVITDRTWSTKGYHVGSTGINSWVYCNNSWTDLDGQPGAEIMINYYARSASSKKGLMIRHRSQSTKATWSCFNLNTAENADETGDSREGVDNSFDNTEFKEKESIMNTRLENLVVTHYAKEFKLEELMRIGERIRISPNPVKNIINVTVNTLDETIRQIIVTDISGKTVLTSNSNSRSVDISKLNKGLYLVRVQTDKETYMKKVLKE